MSQVSDAAAEIQNALGPLPDGFSIKTDEDTENILITSPVLGFAVTISTIKDKLHVVRAKETFVNLVTATAQFYVKEADKLERLAVALRYARKQESSTQWN